MMTSRQRLQGDELTAALKDLAGWTVLEDGSSLRKRFEFADFQIAFSFMTRIALVAERMDHHPDWSNSYGQVTVTLSTHDRSGITALDVELAAAMNEAAGRLI